MSHTIIDFKDNYTRVDEIDLIVSCLLIIGVNKVLITKNFPDLEVLWMDNFKNSANGCTELELQLFITDDTKEKIFVNILNDTILFIKKNSNQGILDVGFLTDKFKSIKLILDTQYPNKNLINVLEDLIEIFEPLDGALSLERTHIVPNNETPSISKIESPEEFFQRSGIRADKDEKSGQPYVPSGSITVNTDGTIIIIPPNKQQ